MLSDEWLAPQHLMELGREASAGDLPGGHGPKMNGHGTN